MTKEQFIDFAKKCGFGDIFWDKDHCYKVTSYQSERHSKEFEELSFSGESQFGFYSEYVTVNHKNYKDFEVIMDGAAQAARYAAYQDVKEGLQIGFTS